MAKKGQHIICLSDGILEQREKLKKKRRRQIEPDNLHWKPPVFTSQQLRFDVCFYLCIAKLVVKLA